MAVTTGVIPGDLSDGVSWSRNWFVVRPGTGLTIIMSWLSVTVTSRVA